MNFSLNFSSGNAFTGNNPLKTGNTRGFAIIEVSDVPITVSLQNDTSSNVFLASVPVTAELRVFNFNENEAFNVSNCFWYLQLVNILEQYEQMYPDDSITIGVRDSHSYGGIVQSVYQSPNGSIPGILILLQNTTYNYINITNIAYFMNMNASIGDDFDFLPLPSNYVETCCNSLVRGYFEIAQTIEPDVSVDLYIGSGTNTGFIYKNEYGIIILLVGEPAFNMFFVTGNLNAIGVAM